MLSRAFVMLKCGDGSWKRLQTVARHLASGCSWRGAVFGRVLLGAAIGVAVASCMSNGPGSLFVDPGHYDAYHCNDLQTRWQALNKRETELRNLMDKASTGPGGTVIGAVAYGTDYQSVLTEKKLVQQAAAEKNCELERKFQSDQSIR
jgi:hypothetical protein